MKIDMVNLVHFCMKENISCRLRKPTPEDPEPLFVTDIKWRDGSVYRRYGMECTLCGADCGYRDLGKMTKCMDKLDD